ncbi:MAG: hypothetical protein J6T29_04720 [Alphaproteobacteria bacterium]|nr:hypothetical protein [Alphaproteobacteria bacterium]
MKKEIFIGCGVFLCLSKVSGMTPKGMAETGGGCAEVSLIDVNWDGSFSSSLGSEMTLNEEFPCFGSDETQFKKVSRGRSKSEEVFFSVPDFDRRQSRGFNADRSRSKSEVLDYDENTDVTDVLAEIERRKLCEKLSDPTENVNNMLKVCIRQLSSYFGRDVFQKLKDSDDLISKLGVLMPEVIDYIDSQESQKKSVIKENEELKKQVRGQIRKEEVQGNYIKNLENKLKIAEEKYEDSMRKYEKNSVEEDICSAFPSEVSSNELFSSVIRYMGDMVENMAHGIGMVSHIHRAFSITGTFFQNYLDLHEKIEIKGPYGEKYEFMGNKNFSQDAMISLDDISKVGDVYNIDLSTICLKLSNDDGENEYILFNSDFVYQGELRGRDITGRGRMFRITGEVQEGEFEDGEYLCKK